MATVPGGWQIDEYARGRDDVPVRAFLAGLEGRDANQAAALLLKLAARGNQLRPPDSQRVAENLFELRGHQVRIFYMFLAGRRTRRTRCVAGRARSRSDEIVAIMLKIEGENTSCKRSPRDSREARAPWTGRASARMTRRIATQSRR